MEQKPSSAEAPYSWIRDKDMRDVIDRGIVRFFSLDDMKAFRRKTAAFFEVEEKDLSSEEYEDFRRFAKHGALRLIAGALNGAIDQADALKRLTELKKRDLGFHDLAHVVVALENGQEENSLIPHFFDDPYAIDDQAQREETRALLWGAVRISSIAMLLLNRDNRRMQEERQRITGPHVENFLRKKTKGEDEWQWSLEDDFDPNDFESFRYTYLCFVYELLHAQLKKSFDEGRITGDPREAMNLFYRLAREGIEHPGETFDKAIRQVFDGYHAGNKRILWDMFYERTKPLLERLERKEKALGRA